MDALRDRSVRTVATSLVLVGTLVLCLWLRAYTESHVVGGLRPAAGMPPAVHYFTPSWTVPLSIAVGVAGVILALLIYGLRRTSR